MSQSADIIVIGGGPNGLTAASLLARTGKSVLLFERRPFLGGLAATEEFHPGFQASGPLLDDACLRSELLDSLGLANAGLKWKKEVRETFLVNARREEFICLNSDPNRTAQSIGEISQKDAEAYLRHADFLGRVSPFLRDLLDQIPPDTKTLGSAQLLDLLKRGASLRRLGKKDMLELLRIAPMCVADYLNEWFESDTLKAGLAGPAVYGTVTGPWSPGSNFNYLLYQCSARSSLADDSEDLIIALRKTAETNGVQIHLNEAVEEVLIENGRVNGVRTAGGSYQAPLVLSSCDPKTTFHRLLPSQHLEKEFDRAVTHFRQRGTTALVHLALSDRATSSFCPGDPSRFQFRVAESLDDLERAFDAVKYRNFSERPALEVFVNNKQSPVVSVLYHFANYVFDPDQKGVVENAGWSDEAKKELLSRTLRLIDEVIPGFSKKILGHEVLTPFDIEERYGVQGGQIHHGEVALDQFLLRPMPSCARYETPIPGLVLCGSGAHPGGGPGSSLSLVPGALAAKRVLRMF